MNGRDHFSPLLKQVFVSVVLLLNVMQFIRNIHASET